MLEKLQNKLAIINNIEEFIVLFPNEKLTINLIYKWCGSLFSHKTIKRVMSKFYKQIGLIEDHIIIDLGNKDYQNILRKINNQLILDYKKLSSEEVSLNWM